MVDGTRIGILGLQGDYAAHGRVLDRLGVAWSVIKKPEQLSHIRGLILPGGESTTLLKLIDSWSFWDPLRRFASGGGAILGTCAGMILVARKVLNPAQRSLAFIDIHVERNSYGRQIDSFEGEGELTLDGVSRPLEMVFIRAPRIIHLGEGVERLASCRGDPVLVRQGRILAASFHPELTHDPTVHRLFLDGVPGF